MPALAGTALALPLDDADPEVRAQAAWAAGELGGDARAVERLLTDASPRVRFRAAMALAKIGRRESIAPLFALLAENADRDPATS